MSYAGIMVSLILINNVVLTSFLGICPAITATRHPRTALSVSFAMILVSFVTTVIGWSIRTLVLVPLSIEFIEVLVLLFLGWGIGHYLGVLLKRSSATLHTWIGRYIPLISTNCIVVGIALIVARGEYTLGEAAVATLALGTGFLLVSFLMSAIQERLAITRVPRSLQGAPIALISAGLIALAFLAFDSVFLQSILG